jgi:quercetin dioxygenase-like cupin family protein
LLFASRDGGGLHTLVKSPARDKIGWCSGECGRRDLNLDGKRKNNMNRRELFAALAATAVASDALAFAKPAGVSPAPADPASGDPAADETAGVMGSKVFDWKDMVDKPNAVGSVRTVCSTPTATLENLEIHISTLNPGLMSHPPHRHPNEELIIVRTGTVETLSNGTWIRVGPGSVIFNGSNQLHGFKNVGAEPAVYHVINVMTEKTPAGGTVMG